MPHVTREQKLIRAEPRFLDPGRDGIPGLVRELKSDGASGLMLDNRGTRLYITAVSDVADTQADEIAPAALAVDCQVKEREIPNTSLQLQGHADCPDFMELERWLWRDDSALVPRFRESNGGLTMSCVNICWFSN